MKKLFSTLCVAVALTACGGAKEANEGNLLAELQKNRIIAQLQDSKLQFALNMQKHNFSLSDMEKNLVGAWGGTIVVNGATPQAMVFSCKTKEFCNKLINALDDKNAFEKLDGYRMLIEQDVFGGFNKMIIQESPSGKLIVLSILNRGRYGRDVDENLIVNGLKPVLSVF